MCCPCWVCWGWARSSDWRHTVLSSSKFGHSLLQRAGISTPACWPTELSEALSMLGKVSRPPFSFCWIRNRFWWNAFWFTLAKGIQNTGQWPALLPPVVVLWYHNNVVSEVRKWLSEYVIENRCYYLLWFINYLDLFVVVRIQTTLQKLRTQVHRML